MPKFGEIYYPTLLVHRQTNFNKYHAVIFCYFKKNKSKYPRINKMQDMQIL